LKTSKIGARWEYSSPRSEDYNYKSYDFSYCTASRRSMSVNETRYSRYLRPNQWQASSTRPDAFFPGSSFGLQIANQSGMKLSDNFSHVTMQIPSLTRPNATTHTLIRLPTTLQLFHGEQRAIVGQRQSVDWIRVGVRTQRLHDSRRRGR